MRIWGFGLGLRAQALGFSGLLAHTYIYIYIYICIYIYTRYIVDMSYSYTS